MFQPGSSGRPVGFPNKHVVLAKELDRLGFVWFEECIKRFRDPATPHSSKDFCLGLIVDRVAPKLKAVEHRMTGGNSTQQVLINVIAGRPADAPITLEDSTALLEDDGSDVTPEALDLIDADPSD